MDVETMKKRLTDAIKFAERDMHKAESVGERTQAMYALRGMISTLWEITKDHELEKRLEKLEERVESHNNMRRVG